MKNIEEILDLERWEKWLYLAVLPAGFICAALVGAWIGSI